MGKRLSKVDKKDPGYFVSYLEQKEKKEKKKRVNWFLSLKNHKRILGIMDKNNFKDIDQVMEFLLNKKEVPTN